MNYSLNQTIKYVVGGTGCFRAVALLILVTLPAVAQDVFTDISRGDANLTTGPEIGQRIPKFEALDQHGVRRGFDDIKGPDGAMILFHRSADW